MFNVLQIIKITIGNVACDHFGYRESCIDKVKFKQNQNDKKEPDVQKLGGRALSAALYNNNCQVRMS